MNVNKKYRPIVRNESGEFESRAINAVKMESGGRKKVMNRR